MKKIWLFLSISGFLAADLSAEWRTYTQTVVVTFATPEAAAQAQLTALPLPPDKKVAFSSRWDDTNNDHSRMVDVLSAHGYKGTFCLNRIDRKYADTAIRKMLDKGCSVGAHTVTHPHLPKLGPNAIFKEILANRIMLESVGRTCVSAFTLPFCQYTSTNNPAMPRIISDCLLRAGLLGGPEYWPDVATKYGRGPSDWVGAYTFSINDRDPQLDLFEKNVRKGLQSIAGNGFECGPHLVLGVHTWQKDERGFNRFGEIIATEANRPDWWYCNENEYVAYRMQMMHCKVVKKSVSGTTAVFTVERVSPFEWGDRIAFGLQVSTVPKEVSAGKQPLPLSAHGGFMLPHDSSQLLPVRFEALANADNRSEPDAVQNSSSIVPGLQLVLYASADKNLLRCTLKNTSTADIRDVRLTFRVPPKWTTGVVAKDVDVLTLGGTRIIELSLGSTEEASSYQSGPLYFAVQCDLTDAHGPARVYGTTEIGQ